MTRRLFVISLMNAYGRGDHPAQAMFLRLGGLFAVASLGGMWAWRAVTNLTLAASPQQLSVVVSGLSFITMTLSLMTAASDHGPRPPFNRLIASLPLGRWHRLSTELAPAAAALCIAMTLFIPAILPVTVHNGLSWPAAAGSVTVGVVGALGLLRLREHLYLPGVHIMCIVIEGWLVRQAFAAPHPAYACWLAIILPLLAGAGCVIRLPDKLTQNGPRDRAMYTRRLPWPWLWWTKKLQRTPAALTSLLSGLAFSSIATLILSRQDWNGSALPSFLASLLTAAACADLRGYSRYHNPAEITAVRGSWIFFRQIVILGLIIGFLIAAPLLLLMLAEPQSVLCAAIGDVTLAVTAGLLASTLFVPSSRDLTSQCGAVFMAAIILIGFHRLPLVTHATASRLALWQVAVCIVCLLAAFGVEYKRNRYLWRSE